METNPDYYEDQRQRGLLKDARSESHKAQQRITTLLAVIEQCREVIEYAGCHDHTEDIPKFNRPCQLCVKVDEALDTIKKLRESK